MSSRDRIIIGSLLGDDTLVVLFDINSIAIYPIVLYLIYNRPFDFCFPRESVFVYILLTIYGILVICGNMLSYGEKRREDDDEPGDDYVRFNLIKISRREV